MRGIARFFEPILHRTYGSIGAFCARYPYPVIITVLLALGALCVGIHTTEHEHNLNDLLIAQRGRINREKDFFVDNFDLISPVLSTVIVTAKEGVDILSVEALDEVYKLQEHIREFTFEYKPGVNVSLEQFCFRVVNENPTEPCFQSSILESFREGTVFNVGGDANTNYAFLFAQKPSYRDFDFKNDFTRSFIATTNSNPDSLMLGTFETAADGNTITSVPALQIAFGAKSPDGLKKDGLQYFEWVEQVVEEDSGFCPDTSACEACADALQPTQFAGAGCTFDGSSTQSDSCCAFLEIVRASPCIEVVFERRAELEPTANSLLAACDLDTVEVSVRCQNQDLYIDQSGPPAVCACLEGATEACSEAAPGFLAQNPQYTQVFVNAANGTDEQVAELGRTLIEDIGCPAAPPVNPLCTCLADSTSQSCVSAITAYLESNPDQSELFTNAATGDEAAVQNVAAFLINEIGCEAPSATEANASPVDTTQTTTTDAPATQYEAIVTVNRDETDTIDKARRVMHEWEKAWREQMWDRAAEFKYIDVTWLTATSLDDEVKNQAEAEVGLIILGYSLVLIYLAMFCSFDWKLGRLNFTKLPPGPGISALCFLSVLLSVIAAMGVAGYISALSSFKVTFITIQMLPLLMLGLGVNDFFVLVSATKSVLLRPGRPQTTPEIMYEMMSIGGTSITLSSAANTCAFSVSTLSPVPVVLYFSVHMAVGVVIAYVVSITIIPAFISISVQRYLEGKPDPLFALFGVNPLLDNETAESSVQGENEGVVASFTRKYRWIITAVIVAIVGVWVGFGVHGLIHFNQGVDFSKAVIKDSYPYNFLINFQDYFDTNQINIVFKSSADYSRPADFQSARKSEYEYVNQGYRTEKRLMTLSWLEFYTQYVEGKFCSNEICMNMVHWYYDGFSSAEFAHPSKNICADINSASECQRTCQNHCPQGRVGSKYRCQYIENKNQCYCPYRPMLKSRYFYENPPNFDSSIRSYWTDFLTKTPQGLASRIFVNLDPDTATESNHLGIPQATRAYVFTRGLQSIPHQLDHIKRGREILDRQDIDTYAFDYSIYGMGEQYENLAARTIKGVGISMAVAAAVMMPLIAHWFAAVIVSCCVLLGVLLAAGTTSWTDLDMDYGVYVALIIAVGLALEFCVHITRDFMLNSGDKMTRILHAMRTMGVAVINGGATTFLGILPSALSDLPTIRDRLFVQYSCVVLAGTFTGLVILPTVLSLIGPPAYESEDKQKSASIDEENQKSKKMGIEMGKTRN
eukprot:g190.t1